METLQMRPATRADIPAITAFIAELNVRPEHRCLHCDEDEATVARSIQELAEPVEDAFEVAIEDGRLCGMIGCDSDQELGRGWLWGPFVDAEPWSQIADMLLNRLIERLPSSVCQLDSFMDVSNQRGVEVYLRHGFMPHGVTHIYVARRPDARLRVEPSCSDLENADTDEFIALHDATFPGTYLAAAALLAKRDAQHRVYVFKEAGALLGYVYASPSDTAGEGFIHYLGVRPDARGRGIGRRLLLAALDWLFNSCEFASVALTVGDERGNAKALYLSAGFEHAYSGAVARKTW